MELPAAQTVSPAAATADRVSRYEFAPGVGATCQRAPSQCMASVRSPPPGFWVPTAHTSREAMAATPLRLLPPGPGLGLGITLQVLPSQCIVSVCGPLLPTAHISLSETADMAQRVPAPGASMTLQARPSQRINSGFE